MQIEKQYWGKQKEDLKKFGFHRIIAMCEWSSTKIYRAQWITDSNTEQLWSNSNVFDWIKWLQVISQWFVCILYMYIFLQPLLVTATCNAGFQCYDGTCLTESAVCDGMKHCPGNRWEDEPADCCELLALYIKISLNCIWLWPLRIWYLH